MGMGITPVETGWGWKQGLREGVRMGTVLQAWCGDGVSAAGMVWGWDSAVGVGMGTVLQAWCGDGDEQLSPCSSLFRISSIVNLIKPEDLKQIIYQ